MKKIITTIILAAFAFSGFAQNDYEFRVVNKGEIPAFISTGFGGTPDGTRFLMALEMRVLDNTPPPAGYALGNMAIYICYPDNVAIQGGQVVDNAGTDIWLINQVPANRNNCVINSNVFSSGDFIITPTPSTNPSLPNTFIRGMNIGLPATLISTMVQDEWIEITYFATAVNGQVNNDIEVCDVTAYNPASSSPVLVPQAADFAGPTPSDPPIFTTSIIDFRKIFFKGEHWTQGSGTDQHPTAADAGTDMQVEQDSAYIKAGFDAEVNNMLIMDGPNAKLTIDPNATLKVNGTATNAVATNPEDQFVIGGIDANMSTGYAQYIGPSIEGTIKQYVGTTEGWRNVSFPIEESSTSDNGLSFGGAPINFNTASISWHDGTTPGACGDFGAWIPTVNVYEFLGSAGAAGPQGDHEWYGADPTVLGGNKGYSIFLGSGFFPTNGVVSIKGTLQDGTVANYVYTNEAPHAATSPQVPGASQQNWAWTSACAPLEDEPANDRQANWDGWVLVANPFPSGLDVDAFCATNGNIDNGQIRIWDRTGNPYQVTSSPNYGYTAMDGDDPANPGAGGVIIPPMQAFFIKTGSLGSSRSLQFLDSHRAFSSRDFQKTTPEHVVVIAMNTADSMTNHAILEFELGATKNYDQSFDSYVLSQPGSTTPQIGFHTEQPVNYGGINQQIVTPLYKNTVDASVGQDSYPLRFWSRTAGNFEFRLDQDRLNPAWKIYIEDTKTAPGVSTEITNSAYNFSYVTTDSPTRFILHYVNTVFGVEEDIVTGWAANSWFNSSDELVVQLLGNGMPSSASISVQDVTGKLLYQSDAQAINGDVTIANNFSAGVYVVSVKGVDGQQRTIKVVKGN